MPVRCFFSYAYRYHHNQAHLGFGHAVTEPGVHPVKVVRDWNATYTTRTYVLLFWREVGEGAGPAAAEI